MTIYLMVGSCKKIRLNITEITVEPFIYIGGSITNAKVWAIETMKQRYTREQGWQDYDVTNPQVMDENSRQSLKKALE